ncbi:methyltransferase domain-containing protein [Fragilaria crotonensis]|nr:methyltransferase domain-containing protein [Fragilaria crotonensis]
MRLRAALLSLLLMVLVSLYQGEWSLSLTSQCSKEPMEDDFRLALRESLGFFNDIRADQWQALKAITKGRIHHSKGHSAGTPVEATFYQMNWDPDFSCLLENSVGQVGSDGHKWVCDPHRLRGKTDCLVYSVGSNGNFDFEVDLQSIAPNCEIHVFDPSDHTQGMIRAGLNGTNYHAWGIKSSYDKDKNLSRTEYSDEMDRALASLAFKTLAETVENLGHQSRRIDIFKIDCEGCEWSTYKDFLKQDLRQILVEVHSVSQVTPQFFDDLHNEGYVIFHKEPNIQWSGGKCTEFSFLKLAHEYFQ